MTATAATTAETPRKDNILGICNAIGEDFGFNPNYLRAVLAAMLLVDIKLMLACYAVLGVVVLASHLIVRPKRVRKTAAAERAWKPVVLDTQPVERRAPVLEAIAA